MSRLTNSLWSKRAALNLIFWGAFVLLGGVPAFASQSVSLTWNPSADTNVAGYRIYFGVASHVYTNSMTVGNVTNITVSGLADGTTYFFGATTVDSSGNESDLSNEASYVIPTPPPPPPTNNPPVTPPAVVNKPPTLNPIATLTINQNAGSQTVTLSGITSGAASEKQLLKITAATSNSALIPKPTISYTSPKTTGTLTFKPVANASGTAVITVTINDGGASNNLTTQSFTVTVIAPPKNTGSGSSSTPSQTKQNTGRPTISKQLTNGVTVAGQTVSLAVAATGKTPIKYQWKFNGTPMVSATNATLTLKNVATSQSGVYSVTVSNPAGSTNSVTALLSVYSTTAATLTSATLLNKQFGFIVDGVPGYKYVVQASSDLNHWVSVQTNTAPFTFVDPSASGFDKRFYRSYNLK